MVWSPLQHRLFYRSFNGVFYPWPLYELQENEELDIGLQTKISIKNKADIKRETKSCQNLHVVKISNSHEIEIKTSMALNDWQILFFNWFTCHINPLRFDLSCLATNDLRLNFQHFVTRVLTKSDLFFWDLIPFRFALFLSDGFLVVESGYVPRFSRMWMYFTVNYRRQRRYGLQIMWHWPLLIRGFRPNLVRGRRFLKCAWDIYCMSSKERKLDLWAERVIPSEEFWSLLWSDSNNEEFVPLPSSFAQRAQNHQNVHFRSKAILEGTYLHFKFFLIFANGNSTMTTLYWIFVSIGSVFKLKAVIIEVKRNIVGQYQLTNENG